MTCIVGYVENGVVYIGGDSAGSSGDHVEIYENKKVFKKCEMIFGYTASYRIGQILEYDFSPPKHDFEVDDLNYLCTDFIGELANKLTEKKFPKENWDFLLGYRGSLYCIDSEFQILKPIQSYTATGSGYQYALGALYTLEGVSMRPEDRINAALKAAEYFDSSVCGPFNIVSV